MPTRTICMLQGWADSSRQRHFKKQEKQRNFKKQEKQRNK
jgi:hypothetical protein